MSGPTGSTQSGHWSRERLHADVHRAVGGSLNLIRELSRISHELDPDVPSDWLIKRTQFFAYELQSLIPDEASERDRLAALNKFFFDSKKFICIHDSTKFSDPSQAVRLGHVLCARSGTILVLTLIYAYLAERIGVTLDFVDFKPLCFLKWTEHADARDARGHSRFIDLTRGGVTLSSDELLDLLHTRYQMTSVENSNLFETVPFDRVMVAYLFELKTAVVGRADPEKLLFLQNALIAYQPSNLQLLADRAVIHRRLGHFRSALSDLKRYFAFHERDRAPQELVKLHDDLVVLLDRHKTNLDTTN